MDWKISRRPRTSTPTSASGLTNVGTSASPMPLRSVGENVPEVMSHSGTSRDQGDAHAGTRDAAADRDEPAQPALGAGLLLREQHVPAPERVLLPADRPAEAGLVGRDVEGDVLAVQRVAHLGAQRVAGAEAAGEDAVRRSPAASSASQSVAGDVVGRDQLVAALAGVAGAAHDHAATASPNSRLHEGHVVVADRQPDRGRAPRRTWCPAPRARRSRRGGRDGDALGRLGRRAGARPRRCWRRWGPAARARRRGSRRSGRRRCRRSRRRSTACTAPGRARSCRGRWSAWR